MLAHQTYSWLLQNLNNFKGNYLEIGMWDGDGIRSLADSFTSKMFYAVDPFIEDGCTSHISNVTKSNPLSEIRNKALNNIKNRKNVFLFEETSSSFSNRMQSEELSSLNIEVVFVDGDHSYDAVVLDSHLAMKILGNKSGIILFDDLQVPDVQAGVAVFENQYKDRIAKKTSRTAPYFDIFEINGI